MKIILKENVSNLGEKGEVVDVKDGYARNYLIPQGMALPHNKKTKRMMDTLIQQEEQKVQREEEEYQKKLEEVKGIKLAAKQKAGEDGKLFGTVTTQDVSDLIKEEQGVEIDKKYIVLEQHISTVGEYDVKVKFAQGYEANFSITVNAEDSEKEDSSKEESEEENKNKKEEEEEKIDNKDE
ncbi:MAG: 50S ribosomal protein L9 [Candidatus Mcinerneyibacterium aminivorans]|jgi:large subunit ribosomal protein L9|uniref:Large ribosomal subunit protein bL9 n=1 Tax=Candidatus Mcinerneyibacterium aminivorans TaxID=2703815 RepID=A0A5D0MKM5_9BACT|nr:MAG: 50S ribosomal protein L9 [Candidatus Mcinerneyibacterium aminivorans]